MRVTHRMSAPARKFLSALFAIALVTALAPAYAVTLQVDSNADTGDLVAGDGTCGTPTPNSCTLRAAIQEANANASTSNTITFAAGQNATTAATAYPAITKPLIVTGPAGGFTINAAATPNTSLFRYTGSGGTYSVSNIDFASGSTSSSAGGGCIYFAPVGTASFTLSNSTLTSCKATAGPGGGIAIDLLSSGSSVTLSGLNVGEEESVPTVGPNTATGNGGGIWLRMAGTGSMTIKDSTISFNEAANGAGIAVARGRLNIENSTISGNTATAIGGGVYLATEAATGGSVRMENVTISGNTATQGGGIGAASDNPMASWVTFSTITGNTGGGIKAQATPGTTFPGTVFNPFTSNIVANNTGGNCAAAFSHSDADNSGYNLTDSTSCGFSQASDHVVLTADLKLGGLAANPIAPNTHALLAGSPAIDAGNLNWVNATTFSDARGADSQDGNLDNSADDPLRDIGAYEFGGFGLIQFDFPGAPNTFSVDEDNGPAQILIKRHGTGTAAATAPTVAFSTPGTPTPTATQGDCGTGGADWTQLAAGATNFSFIGTAGPTQFDRTASITICNDQIADPDETFNLLLAKPGTETVGYDLGPRSSGTVAIVDAENGTFQFDPATASYQANEGDPGANGSVTLALKRTVGSKGAVRVNYTTQNDPDCSGAGCATANVDYTSVTSFVDFADGETSKTVTINFIGDSADEPTPETFQVALSSVSCQSLPVGRSCDARLVGGATHADRTRIVTIADDDAAVPGSVQLEFGQYTVNESTVTLAVKAKRVGGKDGAVGVTYGATDGTATQTPGPDQDFVIAGNPPGTFTLSWGDQDNADKTFNVTLVNDANRESDKTFTLNLTSPTGGAALGNPSAATVRLVSDEQPRFQFSANSYTEQEGGTMVTLTVTSDAFTGPSVTVPFYTLDGTATSPVDYTGVPQASPQTLSFDGSGTSKTINIPIISDSAVEGNETFSGNLGTPTGGGTITGTNPVPVTIVDPSAVRFTASSFSSVSEANASTITVIAERVGNLNGMVAVTYTITQNCSNPPPAGCAEESVDYTSAGGFSGTLSWADMTGGTDSFTITILGDTLIEGNESIQVSLSPSTGTPAIGGSPATAVVTDDDYRFEILDSSPLSAGEGDGNATIQVRRVGSTVGAASIGFATADGTATAGSDYTQTQSPPTLSWAAGEGGFKAIAVPLTDDALDESNETFTVALSSPSNNVSGEASAVSGSPLTVQIADNDAVNVSFTAASQTVGENAGTVTVTATRTGSTTFDITIPFTVSGTAANPADHNAANGSITILTGNATGSTTFTVSDETVDEADESVILTMGVPSGGDVSAVAPTAHTVTITDDDTAGVVVTQSGGTTAVSEAGATDTYTLVLTSQPTADVTVTLTGDADVSGSPGSLTFTSANWNVAQTVTVIATSDAIAEGAHSGVLTHAATSADAGYNGIAVASVTASITDDDTAGVIVTQSGGSTAATEGGATDTYTIVLTSQPTADVTITVTGDADASGTPGSLTFTSANWNVARTVTVTATNDAIVEGAHSGVLTHAATSADAGYNGIAAASVTASITDNDTAGVTVTQSGGTTAVSEAGATDTYTLVLTSQPSASVTITVTPNAQVTRAPASLTFTTANWNVAQTVTIGAVNDASAEGTHSGAVTHSAASADPDYNGRTVAGVAVTIADNDTAGVNAVQSGGSTAVTEGGATDTLTIALTSQPTANVTITPSTGVQIAVTPATLTFTPANWNVAQTVTVRAVDDAEVEGTHTASLGGSLSSADAAYNGSLTPIAVTITDNDIVTAGEGAPGVVVTPSGNVASGGGGGGAFSWGGLFGLLALAGLRRRATLGVALALASTVTLAQTPAGQAQQFSYDSVDLRYLSVSVDEPSVDAAGFALAGSWAVGKTYYVLAGYSAIETDDFALQGVIGSTETTTLALGAGLHYPAGKAMEFTAALNLLSASADGQGGFQGSADDTGFGVEGGLRGSLSSTMEWSAALSWVSVFDDDDTALTGQTQWRVGKNWSVLAGAGFGSNSRQANIGARYNF